MWFNYMNGDLNKIFDDFYEKIMSSKLIFLALNKLDIFNQIDVREFVDEVYWYNDENRKMYFSKLYFVGIDIINGYLYEALYSKIYSEYEYFIKELVAYLKQHDEKQYKHFCKFSQYKDALLKEIMNAEIEEMIEHIDDIRVVRNHIIHNNSIVDEATWDRNKDKIENVVDLCDELKPLEFIEITEFHMECLYDSLETLMHKIRDYFISKPDKFRIKGYSN
ncbi:hypothetical protein [Clostridium sp. UBA7339]|uniref:hypothetical protein n=1 Tax=Clostridium sp. UBA7339 TaxID=1946376 RepID=UPI0032172FCE